MGINAKAFKVYPAEYQAWADMRKRCNNPKYKQYKDYGGRGIKVCKEWDSFARFLCDVGLRPTGLTLDRINNDGNYEPGNVKWSTRLEQVHNRRNSRKNRRTHDQRNIRAQAGQG